MSGFSNNFTDDESSMVISASPSEEQSTLTASLQPIQIQSFETREKIIRKDLLQNDNNGDLLLGADDHISERHHLRKQLYHQPQPHQQSQPPVQTTTATTTDLADLPEELRVSKLRQQSGLPSSTIVSVSPTKATITTTPTSSTTTKYAAIVKEKPEMMCARAAQTDLVCNRKVSTARLLEGVGSSVFETYFDAINYNDDSVSGESVDISNLTLDVRNTLLAMRLNVPAATAPSAVAANKNLNHNSSTTSVFLPLNESNATTTGQTNVTIGRRNPNINGNGTVTTGAIVQPQPSLTIQVNQSNQNHQLSGSEEFLNNSRKISHDQSTTTTTTATTNATSRNIVNQSTGISVVNCYSSSVPHNNSNCSVNSAPNVVTTTTTGCNNYVTNNSLSVSDENLHDNGLQQINGNPANTARPLRRTFTSTECQTDDLHLDQNEINPNLSPGITQSQTEALITREQRRRERRERRQGRNRHPHILPPPPPPIIRPMLPDILHSHFPPPYTALSLTNPPPPPSSLITPVISTVPIATAVNDGRFTIPLPVIRRSPSERSGKGCCGQWFAGPPLRALIAVVALGGVACALGGAALGATGLAGPPTSHLTAALLMIGVGVILVTVSGAAWRMTAPGGPPCLGLGSTVDLGRCGRRPCNSRGAPHGLLYPEFQHRPPPPSYQASMQEYRLRLLLLDRDRQNGVIRGGSPPPTYRSHAGSLLRAPLSTTTRSGCGAGSEYSLPPSYRSRNPNVNNNSNPSRPPTVFGDESMESLGSNNCNIVSSQGNVPECNLTATTTTSRTPPVEQSTTITTTSSSTSLQDNPINFEGLTAITKESSNCRPTDGTSSGVIVDSNSYGIIGGTFTRKDTESQSQNINEKFNPRVTSSSNCSSSCTKGSNPTSKTEQSCTGINRKELVTIVTISACQGPEQSQSEMEILAHL